MAKKKNKLGTYIVGFGLAFLLVGVVSKIELPTTNTNSSSNLSSSVENNSSKELYDGFEKIKITNSDLFVLEENSVYSAEGVKSYSEQYTSYAFTATKKCQFYIECSLSTIQYVIKTPTSCVRYQLANGTYVDGKENTFDLNPGDQVFISSIWDLYSLDFYLKTL